MTERRGYSRHGLNLLKVKVKVRGLDVLDRRMAAARGLIELREALVADLGGVDVVSTAQCALVELATRTKLYIDSVDSWIMEHGTLVNNRNRSLLPVVRERQQLADSLARILGQLGLERKAKPRKSLASYVVEKYGQEKNGDEKTTPTARPKREPVKREPVIVDIPARTDETTS